MATGCLTKEHADELRVFIAIAEACHRNGSYSWHILDWMSYRMSLKYPLTATRDQVINWNGLPTS